MKKNTPKKPLFQIFNRMKDSMDFKTRLFLSFFLIAVPILLTVCIGFLAVFQVSTRESIQKSQATELERVSAQLLYVISDTENLSRELIFNDAVQEIMIESYQRENYPEDSDVTYYVNSFLANRDFVDCVVLCGIDHTVFSTKRAYTNLSAFDNIENKWWYPDMISGTRSYSWYSYSHLDSEDYLLAESTENNSQNALMLARPIYDMSDYTTLLGYMMIYLDEDYLNDILGSVTYGETSAICMLDKNGQIFAGNHTSAQASLLEEIMSEKSGSSTLRAEGKRYVFTFSDFSQNRWTLCMITPYNEVNSSVTNLVLQLVIMMSAVILILFLIARFNSINMALPIVTLSRLMDTYHGEDKDIDAESLAIYQKRTDEIGQMYRSYYQLEDRINTLIQEIYVKNLEKKDAELALIQSQIDPHFLYNTLDSINWIALANDQDEISDMITALADMFRLSLMKNSSSFTELSQEIRYVQSYLTLQQFRYGERLRSIFDLPDPLPDLYIPRFILQPVAENALKHGIDQLNDGGTIKITLSIDSRVVFTVTNDGNDIDLDKMAEILTFDPAASDLLNFKKDGYGVQNIYRRIKIICGDEYGMSYSKTDSQTICTITLPIKTSL
ncbi:MAG: sensor histidine kinase [Clostridiales bacterium]|nr:sensor histidine kinase [Clostridiales bacterium]